MVMTSESVKGAFFQPTLESLTHERSGHGLKNGMVCVWVTSISCRNLYILARLQELSQAWHAAERLCQPHGAEDRLGQRFGGGHSQDVDVGLPVA
jgi:hypothetical protein